jgi:formylglycine-generating enzyme required for sulfatase activity
MKTRLAGNSPRTVCFLLFFGIMSLALGAQVKPGLQIMPMTAAAGPDDEALAVLFSREETIRGAFTLIAGEESFDRVLENFRDRAEPVRPRSEYLLFIHTEALEHGKIAFAALVETGNLRLAGGLYRRYFSPLDLLPLLPEAARILAETAEAGKDKPKLAVLPFSAAGEGEKALLTLLVSAEIAREGSYGVFPWEPALSPSAGEAPRLGGGVIASDYLSAVRRKTGAPYVLTADVVTLGTSRRLMLSILETQDGKPVQEAEGDYRVLAEDLTALPEIAGRLTQTPPPEVPPPDNLVWIAPGSFIMGSLPEEAARDRDETPHPASVEGFYLDAFEVTQREYLAVTGSNPSRFRGPDLPVERVSWLDAILYCNARSLREGLTPAYTLDSSVITWDRNANGYRLPTEAEWEYACRAGTLSAFNRGNTLSTGEANYDGTYPYNKGSPGLYRKKTIPVGSFAPNAWGLYDMHGNVYEWCWDTYGPYTAPAPEGLSAGSGIIRGGSWYSEGRFLRSANRARANHGSGADYIGFRTARNGGPKSGE